MAGAVGVAEPPITEDGAAARTIRRRSSLPTGRAVVGGFLVSVAALGVLLSWMEASQGPDTVYVVAKTDLLAGTVLEPKHLDLQAMDLGPATSRVAFTDFSRVIGATVVARVGQGELLHPSDVVRRQSAEQGTQMSFSVESDRALGGAIEPGERVDVVATFGTGADSYTLAVVQRAVVIDVVRASTFAAGKDRLQITVALDAARDSLALAHALNAGEVFVVRTSESENHEGEPYRAPRSREGAER